METSSDYMMCEMEKEPCILLPVTTKKAKLEAINKQRREAWELILEAAKEKKRNKNYLSCQKA